MNKKSTFLLVQVYGNNNEAISKFTEKTTQLKTTEVQKSAYTAYTNSMPHKQPQQSHPTHRRFSETVFALL